MVAIPKLDLFEHEPEPDPVDGFAGDVGSVLGDEEVDRLLSSTSPAALRVAGRPPDSTIQADASDDGLAAGRGLLIGLALVLPVWCLVLAALLS